MIHLSRSRRSVGAAVLLAALTRSPTARAQAAQGAQASAGSHLHGLEIMVRPAFGAASSDSPVRYEPSPSLRLGDPGTLLQGATPYGAGFVGQALIGYRFHPVISAGLRVGLRTASASALTDGSTNLARSAWDGGIYVRTYPLAQSESTRKYLDPWLAVGVEYLRDAQSFQRPISLSAGASVDGDWTLTHHSVAVPLGIGVDYRILPMVSLGPSFEYTIANGVTGCAKAAAPGYSSNTFCSDQDPGKQVIKAKTYGVWSVGLDLKVTLFE